MTKVRLVLAAALLTVMPHFAWATPFTVEFTVAWDLVSNPTRTGSGAVIGFVVDNGALSPLNQTYLVTDVKAASVNTTPFGGTYDESFQISQIDHENLPFTLFHVAGSGQAVMDFTQVGGTTFYSPPAPGSASQFLFQHTLNIWFTSGWIRFFEHSDSLLTESSASRAVVSNGQLVGSVPDSAGALKLLVLAFGCLVTARWRFGSR